MTHSPELAQQIATLAARYGQPRSLLAQVPDGLFSPFTKSDRYGEVCMVVRRPNGRLITARKRYYPRDCYRLLTGGIAHGEAIESALLRETDEETGLTVNIRRFLAVIDYTIAPDDASSPGSNAAVFVTFAFLLDETGGVLMPKDESEEIEQFREVLPETLPALANILEQLPDRYDDEITGNWHTWGLFRAAVHRAVYAALTES
jgi:8-oxo-dGTP pyrophosphatase MutT (NUDIX family)